MEACATVEQQQNLIPLDQLEKEWADGIREMTRGGVKPHLMYRCIAESIKPQKLGPRGARKVSCNSVGVWPHAQEWMLA